MDKKQLAREEDGEDREDGRRRFRHQAEGITEAIERWIHHG